MSIEETKKLKMAEIIDDIEKQLDLSDVYLNLPGTPLSFLTKPDTVIILCRTQNNRIRDLVLELRGYINFY